MDETPTREFECLHELIERALASAEETNVEWEKSFEVLMGGQRGWSRRLKGGVGEWRGCTKKVEILLVKDRNAESGKAKWWGWWENSKEAKGWAVGDLCEFGLRFD